MSDTASVIKHPCNRCGRLVERRRFRRHHASKGCRDDVAAAATEHEMTVEEYLASDHVQGTPERRRPEPRRAPAPLLMEDDAAAARAAALAEAAAEAKEAENNPRCLYDFELYMREGGSLKASSVDNVLMWARRYMRFGGRRGWRDERELADAAVDQERFAAFYDHVRDARRLGVPSLLRAAESLLHLLTYVEMRLLPEARRLATEVRAMRLYLDQARRRARRDGKALQKAGTDGRTAEQLERAGEWARPEQLREAVKKGGHWFHGQLEALAARGPDGAPPTTAEARRLGAFVMFAVVVRGAPVRSGTLEELTENEGRELAREGVVSTRRFKTAGKYGEVALVAGKWLCTLLGLYDDVVRRLVTRGRPQRHYFVVADGKPMSKSGRDVGDLTQALIGARLTVTRLRQVMETASAEHADARGQEAVSRAMTHTGQVARRNYQKVRAVDAAREAREVLDDAMGR
jgi:hypothetical protein